MYIGGLLVLDWHEVDRGAYELCLTPSWQHPTSFFQDIICGMTAVNSLGPDFDPGCSSQGMEDVMPHSA